MDLPSESWPRRLHRIADAIDRKHGARIRATRIAERLWIRLLDSIVASQSDRRYLRRAILPALARAGIARLLFVGVRGYTAGYAKTFSAAGAEYWTCDIDPAAAPHGVPGRHRTVDACRLDEAFPADFFDVIVMNGVFGWGLDDPEDMNRALAAVHRVLRPGGYLLLGWNCERNVDPAVLPGIRLFDPVRFGGLPERRRFPDVTHVYAWYRACSSTEAA